MACPVSESPIGIVQTPAVARVDIRRHETLRGGAIDPRYLNDQRAAVRQDNGVVDIFDVPQGMTVQVGHCVALFGSYRSAAFPCSYLPILLSSDLPVG